MKNNKLIVLTIYFNSNNILFSLTSLNGNVIFWTSLGIKKIKGTKKITSTSVLIVLKEIYKRIHILKYDYVYIKLKGFGKSKKIIVKYLKQSFLNIVLMLDETSFPHNGCKKSNNRKI